MQVIAIVGRPNVGKSSLFNRITGQTKSIVNEVAGVTRDRLYCPTSYAGKDFIVVDTGGFEPQINEKIKNLILKQTEVAIAEADKILVLFDLKTGLHPDDRELVEKLRKTGKSVYYAVNKIDAGKSDANLNDFYSLGIDKFLAISALHGTGINDLLTQLTSDIEETPTGKDEELAKARPGIAIVGRPNVGKSSLVNKLLKYERVMVDDRPGTTRDAIDTPFTYNNNEYLLIDTAGIRRRSKIEDELEGISVLAALKAVERATFVALMIDASGDLAHQDLRILSYAISRRKAVLLIVNKMDLMEDYQTIDFNEFSKKVEKTYPAIVNFPMLFISVKDDYNLQKVMQHIEILYKDYFKKIQTKTLNKFFGDLKINLRLGFVKGKKGVRAKLKYIVQKGTGPAKFLVFCNNPEYIRDRHDKFITNQIRKEFGFKGVPISIEYRES
jgi:GTPase